MQLKTLNFVFQDDKRADKVTGSLKRAEKHAQK